MKYVLNLQLGEGSLNIQLCHWLSVIDPQRQLQEHTNQVKSCPTTFMAYYNYIFLGICAYYNISYQ